MTTQHDIPGLLAMAAETSGLRAELRKMDKKILELRAKLKQYEATDAAKVPRN